MIVIPEILEIIFSYLYYPVFYPKFLLSCALVSRSWSYNALPFLWKIKLENFELIDDNLDCLKKLLVSQRKLRNLELNFLIKQDFSDLFLSLKGHSNLNYVKISYCLFNKILPIKILSSCNNLEELIIESSEIEENDSIEDTVDSVDSYESIDSIDHLTIGQVFKRMGNLISNNLKKLFITSYYYFTEDEFKDFLFNYYNNHNNNGNLKQLSINICGDKLNTLNLLKDYSNEINKNLIIKQWDTKNYDGKKNNQLQHQKLTTPKLNNRYNIKSDNNNIKINVPHPFVSIRIAISHALCVGLIRIIRTPSSLFTIKINLYSKSNTVILSTSDSIIFPFVFTLLSFYPPNVHDDLMLTNVDCRFFLE
ncbi:hypothetical protein GLOIN_2v1496022 [Rhizophagus irregularis DAOM 181602=DAOM 197198]|nr:hypothetical protein GLOIN_2v1496022 [Rhizophagus irregularis DAOM 181602=DAOM 197198]